VTSSPLPLSFAASASPRYVAGDASLDFVNTVDWTSRGLEEEQLADYADLLRWARGAGLLAPPLAAALALAAASAPAERELALASARHARWVLRRLLSSVASGRIDRRAVAAFNEILAESARRLMLDGRMARRSRRLRWTWRGVTESLESPVWLIVWSAAQLLTSDERAFIKECGGRDCGWLFVDRSRNGLRRWCEMRTCGTREKSRRRARRTGAGA
jgi:predicted RNA-binding Zn ribbon-like protein